MSEAIPKGWSRRMLGEVSELRTSNVDKKSSPGEVPVRLCNYMDVYGNDYITADLPFMEASALWSEIEKFGLRVGDVIITKDSETPDDIGIPAVVVETAERLVCGYHLALIRPKSELIDSVYLAKYLSTESVVSHFLGLANGSTRYGLTQHAIYSTPLLLPPLPTQRRIAAVLRTVDEVIEATEARIEKQQAIKQGLLHDLFTRGVTPDGQLRPPPSERPDLYRDSELGVIPREWEVVSLLESVLSRGGFIQTGPFGSQLHAREYVAEGVAVIMPQNIDPTGAVDFESAAKISTERASQLSRHIVKVDDVVFSRRGDLSLCAVGESGNPDAICGTGCLLLRPPASGVSGRWIASCYRLYQCQRQIAARAVGTTMVNLNTTLLSELLIPVPGDDEQEGILVQSAALNAELSALTLRLAKLRHLKSALMQDLLTGRVSADSIDLEAITT